MQKGPHGRIGLFGASRMKLRRIPVTWTVWLPASEFAWIASGAVFRPWPEVDLAQLGLLGDGDANSQHAVVQVTIRPEQRLFTSDHQARIRPSQRPSRSAPITSSGNSMTATKA